LGLALQGAARHRASAAIRYAASRLAGIPVVTTVHNSSDRHSVVMRVGDCVVAVRGSERDHLIERGHDPARVSAIWKAPDKSPRVAFMQNGRDHRLVRPRIVTICSLHRRRGVADLIEACGGLFVEFLECRLAVAGEGRDRTVPEQQTVALGLADRVAFPGFVPAPRTLFAQTDTCGLAAYADPGSRSIGGARAAGCAIVATAVGRTTEMIDFGAAGRLVSARVAEAARGPAPPIDAGPGGTARVAEGGPHGGRNRRTGAAGRRLRPCLQGGAIAAWRPLRGGKLASG
jgi:glycosyltransferase involved in cell wall biosynthesis